MSVRLKHAQLAPARAAILKKQKGKCPLCGFQIRGGKKPALDHDHQTGILRSVLCVNCNGIEGKVFNLARRCGHKEGPRAWLTALLEYYELHDTPQHGTIFHPTHKTEEEKRLARNAKARKKRAALKGK